MAGARQKLNQIYVNGSLLLAALAGWLTQSWPVFFLALAVLLGLGLYTQEIRLGKPDRRSRPRARPNRATQKGGKRHERA